MTKFPRTVVVTTGLLLAVLAVPSSALAAAVVDAVATTPSTSNTTSYASASFTPAAGDLLVVYVTASGTVAAGTMTDSQGLGFTKITSVLKNASADTVYMFVANNLAAATAMTVTFDCTGDAATGAIIQVARVSGMTKTGASAVRQTQTTANGAAAGTPAATFASAALTGNPTLGVVGNSSSPATLTPPTGWTEREDQGYSTPTTGAEYATRDSGFTGTTITWASTSATAFGVIIAELDASAAPPTVTTNFAGSINFNSANLVGSITSTGGANATQTGFAYGFDGSLATGVSTTTLGAYTGTGPFNGSIGGLTPGLAYFYRAYATNSGGTGYGSILSFTPGSATPTRKMRLFEGFHIKVIGGKLILYGS